MSLQGRRSCHSIANTQGMKINWKKIIIGEISFKRLIRSFFIIYVFLIIVGLFFSEKLIFPYNESSYTESLPGLKLIEAKDGTRIAIRYWQSSNDKFLLLYFHGNGEDVGNIEFIVNKLVDREYSVLSIDYRGYGLSAGKPTELSTYLDGELLYNTAIGMGYTPDKIIIWGRSVGSGPAVDLALNIEVRALVLESPFISAFRVATKVPIVPFDRFDNLSKIGKVDEPLFIIHGESDEIIGSWHSERLFNEHNGRKRRYLISNAGHNNLWSYDLSDALNQLDLFINNRGEQTNGL